MLFFFCSKIRLKTSILIVFSERFFTIIKNRKMFPITYFSKNSHNKRAISCIFEQKWIQTYAWSYAFWIWEQPYTRETPIYWKWFICYRLYLNFYIGPVFKKTVLIPLFSAWQNLFFSTTSNTRECSVNCLLLLYNLPSWRCEGKRRKK